jgi:hypothetical protein
MRKCYKNIKIFSGAEGDPMQNLQGWAWQAYNPGVLVPARAFCACSSLKMTGNTERCPKGERQRVLPPQR